jgi:O-antigen ligase
MKKAKARETYDYSFMNTTQNTLDFLGAFDGQFICFNRVIWIVIIQSAIFFHCGEKSAGMAAAVIAAAVVIIIRRRNWLVIMLVGVVVAGMAAGVAPKLRINEGWGARPEIWSKTGPMLKETALIGHGPGTYAFYYQHPAGECISKPHNMYLQIWTGTGGISLLGFLVLTGAYLVKNIRRTDMTGVGIYGGVVAYLIAGLANDSVVSVAPVFWVLFGLGMKSFAPVYLQSKNKLRRSQ